MRSVGLPNQSSRPAGRATWNSTFSVAPGATTAWRWSGTNRQRGSVLSGIHVYSTGRLVGLVTSKAARSSTAPEAASFVAYDERNLAAGASPGDQLRVTFDRATDMGGYYEGQLLEPHERDRLFHFEPPFPPALNAELFSRWTDTSTFTLTLGGRAVELGFASEVGHATVRVGWNASIRTKGQAAARGPRAPTADNRTLTLAGSFGDLADHLPRGA